MPGKNNVLNAHLAQVALGAAQDLARLTGRRPQHTIRLKHGKLPLLTMNQRDGSTSRVVSLPHIKGENAAWNARQLTLVTEKGYGSPDREFAMSTEDSSHIIFKLPYVAQGDQIPTMRAALRITVNGAHYFTTPVYLSMEIPVRRANRTWQRHPAALAAVLQVDLRFDEDTELCFFFSSPPWTMTADDLRAECQYEVDEQQLVSLAAAVKAATPQHTVHFGVAAASEASAARFPLGGAAALDPSACAGSTGDGAAYCNAAASMADTSLSSFLDSPMDDDVFAEMDPPIGHRPFGFQLGDPTASDYLLGDDLMGLDYGMSTSRSSAITLVSPPSSAFVSATRIEATMSPPAESLAPSSFFDEDFKYLGMPPLSFENPSTTPRPTSPLRMWGMQVDDDPLLALRNSV
jgi:hypothetical protein